MLKTLKNNKLISEGYEIIEGVIPSSELHVVREACSNLTKDRVTAYPSDVLGDQLVSKVLTNTSIIEVVRSVLGENILIFPNFTVRRGVYEPWHIDGAFTENLGGTQGEPLFVQCGVYLQSNDELKGGQVDIIPKSHERIEINDKLFASANLLDIAVSGKTVNAGAGGAVLWDGRLVHQSTPQKKYNEDPKLGVFMTFASVNANWKGFLKHLRKRGEVQSNNPNLLVGRYQDMENIGVKNKVPLHIVNEWSSLGVKLVTFADM
ncbi:phytanoyl-CoA dioxygenase family protein [Bacillus cereus group sp. BfR-BA-01380]|uniref:phytanoyl-CoA dioxygenase family protein n=1 Tax=Bacillus cereus group sp. BfR-BA-01380 TaxID=2920324 RepID=UPI001F5913ED|nr:phytanoyl-CoA dioxygenase family protein [Bacillus cereus group sp. BfR-BA-01380]